MNFVIQNSKNLKNYYLKNITVLEPTISCLRNKDSTETRLTEKTVKSTLIHASTIYPILWIHWIQWTFCSISGVRSRAEHRVPWVSAWVQMSTNNMVVIKKTFVHSQKCTKLKHIKIVGNFLQSSFWFVMKH